MPTLWHKLTESEVQHLKPRDKWVIVRIVPPEERPTESGLVGVQERYPSISVGEVVKCGDMVFELDQGDRVMLPVRVISRDQEEADPVYIIIPEADVLGVEEKE